MILCFRGCLNYVLRLLKSSFKELDEAADVEIVASDRSNLITLRVQNWTTWQVNKYSINTVIIWVTTE